MEVHGVEACVFTSMHNIAYYSGFLYCSFGRPYGLVVTPTQSVTISAGIDAGQPWRRCHGDNITYTDWPVSYTHLDVYKRQPQHLMFRPKSGFGMLPTVASSPASTVRSPGQPMTKPCRRANTSFSYIRLARRTAKRSRSCLKSLLRPGIDVYKRQGHGWLDHQHHHFRDL